MLEGFGIVSSELIMQPVASREPEPESREDAPRPETERVRHSRVNCYGFGCAEYDLRRAPQIRFVFCFTILPFKSQLLIKRLAQATFSGSLRHQHRLNQRIDKGPNTRNNSKTRRKERPGFDR